MRRRAAAFLGSAVFLIIAPGTVAGLLPWLISRWRVEDDFGFGAGGRVLGGLLIVGGLAGLLDSFVRFAWRGRGTPAPIAPTDRLIVSGFYRHVRNPMYVSVVGLISGQAMLFGQVALVGYAALVWLVFHLFIILYEEPALRRQFPQDYQAYRRAVPRWVPRPRPWIGARTSI